MWRAWRELPAYQKGRILVVTMLGCWLLSLGYVLCKLGMI